MDPRKIFIWNVRGLNSTSRQSSVRSFIDSLGVDIVCLQETKMQEITRIKVIAILGANFEHFVY
jgi:exonuclease III